jgi:hypothetical protein
LADGEISAISAFADFLLLLLRRILVLAVGEHVLMEEHSGNMEGIFREPSENIQGIFREPSGNIQGTTREQ